jgi:hypothetical protein
MRQINQLLTITFLALSGCRPGVAFATQVAETDSLRRDSVTYSVFLIGDAGDAAGAREVLELLRQQLQQAGQQSTVVFLGDNLFPEGLPAEEEAGRPAAEKQLLASLDALEGYPGKVVFTPGDRDWQRGKRNGWQYVRNQQQFIEGHLGREGVFIPGDGCSGPVEVPLAEDLLLVVLNLQWWLHPWDKPGEESACEIKDGYAAAAQLEDILERNRHKQIIVADHHPLYSRGPYGGYATWREHLFPLTTLSPALYLPLPGVGSLYTLYRRTLGGSVQNLNHPRYRALRHVVNGLLRQHPGLIYASGHDHSLQYLYKDSVHYVVSGAGSQTTPVGRGKHTRFAASRKGFARLDFTAAGQGWLAFWETAPGHWAGRQAYRQLLPATARPAAPPDPSRASAAFPISTVAAAGPGYRAGNFKTWLLGSNYRREWTEPVAMPVFDIAREMGGMKVVDRGGGMQTKSLHLTDSAGRQYVLRLVQKYPEKAIPAALRETLAADVVQDQISASHPYGALAVPPMARAAGILHLQPRLVFIPEDSRLGKYSAEFGNMPALLEAREVSLADRKGENKSYNTHKMIELLQAGHDNQVDAREVLRARLFDVLIGDWDRHDDQWRWVVSGQEGHRHYFSPVPRDRDQVFYINTGLLPKLATRKWLLPKFQGFDHQVRDVTTFNFNARYFDRSFLTGLSLPAWQEMADSLQTYLTDAVIENAIRQLPDSVYRLSGVEIIAKLKSRRASLGQEATKHYLFLAREVDVTGSEQNEHFRVVRQADGGTRVRVSAPNQAGAEGRMLYERTFHPHETREVRLYGLGGDDVFEVDGHSGKGITIRIIGGPGNDRFSDQSSVKGARRRTRVYDTRTGNALLLGPESRDLTANTPRVNAYDRKAFRYHYAGPLFSAQFNPDDGLFIGTGLWIKRQGFRKEPFATQHRLTANYAFATSAYNFDYRGDLTDVFGELDVQLNLEARAPNFTSNFFGLGNQSVYNQDDNGIAYYRVRFDEYRFNALLRKTILGSQTVFIGPAFESVKVNPTAGRRITQEPPGGPENTGLFRRKHYGGLLAGFTFDNRNNPVLPTEGTYWHTEAGLFAGLNDNANRYARVRSDLSFYWSFRLPARVTLATRFGGAVVFGDYEFFQASTLGGLTNLRGLRRNRFSGKSSLYNNTELRLRLLSFRTYLFPAYAGLLGFWDTGRVWLEGEGSDQWHTGYGAGVWIAPFKRTVVSFMYGISKDDRLPSVKMGFFF